MIASIATHLIAAMAGAAAMLGGLLLAAYFDNGDDE